ncbi:MAG: hypothetical protein ACOYU5_06250 [Stygiobacter sp.]
MKRIDELINKYIDSEISNIELEELQELLKDDDNFKSLKSFQLIEYTIKNIKVEKASESFTTNLMNIILTADKVKKIRKSYLPLMINSIFVLFIFSFVIMFLSFDKINTGSSNFNLFLENIVNNLNSFVPQLKIMFVNKTVIFLSSIISLLLLIIFYYNFEAHKAFRKKLENM